MYEDSDIEEEGYPPVSSTGYPRGGSDLSNSQKRGVSGAQGGPYIRPAQFRASRSVHSGSGWGSVVRCSSPVGDYDFVPPRDTLRDPTSQGSYVAPAPGKSPTVQSASAALESEDHVVQPQPLPSASNVLAPQTLTFDSPPTHGQQPHPSPSAGSTGPAPQPSKSQHAGSQGVPSGTTNPVRGDNYVASRPAQSTDLQSQGYATQTPTAQGHIAVTSGGGTPTSGHSYSHTTHS